MFTLLFSILNATNGITQNTGQIPNLFRTIIQFLPFILVIVIFYFFLIRPQNKQRQALNNMINNLKTGNSIITKGGIIGKIDQILENSFVIELHDGTKIEILKHAVISMLHKNSK